MVRLLAGNSARAVRVQPQEVAQPEAWRGGEEAEAEGECPFPFAVSKEGRHWDVDVNAPPTGHLSFSLSLSL